MLSLIAAAMHVGCIIYGAPWYRFLGAGEEMATLAEQGSKRPTVITSFIVLVLTIWSIYGFSGAGLMGALPLLKLGLVVITTIYLLRGVIGFLLTMKPMGRSINFWIWSSIICSAIGAIHLIGLIQVWNSI